MNINFSSGNRMIKEIDKENFTHLLYQYYDMDHSDFLITDLEAKIRSDIKVKGRMNILIEYTKCSDKDFFYHLISIFPGIFNKFMIRKIRTNLNRPEENDAWRNL